MNITLVAHDLVRSDGQGRINYEIARYALTQGHALTILSDRIEPGLLEAGVEYVPIHPAIKKPGWFDVRLFGLKADRVLRRRQRDGLLVANGYTLSVPHDVNLCQFVHGSWIKSPVHTVRHRPGPYGWYQYLYSRSNARWEKQAYAATKITVVPSELARRELIGIGVNDSTIVTIPNGVDLSEFQTRRLSRQELNLPADVPLALFVGDIQTPRKNLDTVLKALPEVPGLHLAVVGKLPRSPYPRLAERMGLADRVHFLGFRRDVGKIMRAVDLFVFPSRYDTFAIVVLEAMASGVPTITAASVGASELMTPESGVVVNDPESATELAGAIKQLLADPARRQEMGLAARKVAEQYSWTTMAKRYLEVFESVAGKAVPA